MASRSAVLAGMLSAGTATRPKRRSMTTAMAVNVGGEVVVGVGFMVVSSEKTRAEFRLP